MSEIVFWNRKTGQQEKELVYGDAALDWAYGSKVGQWCVDHILSRRFPSQLYGAYQASSLSQQKIKPFIEKFKIPMEEFEDGPFSNFNSFFVRKFKPTARPFVQGERFPAFSEARYFAYRSVENETRVPVKGKYLSSAQLLGSQAKAKPFEGGPMLLARLCPVDYHRFHFPDTGALVDRFRMAGNYHSVNPKALRYREDIFITNEREVSILETEYFGKLAYIEVGALCVGRIIQSHASHSFLRGDEKGYFLFGASTVIVLGEKGAWEPDGDLLEQTKNGRETLVRLGEQVATRVGKK